MLEIEIRDFQSISHQVIKVSGFTALVGRSNIGKSATVRAVKAALTGSPVENLVRHGAQCQRITKGSKTCRCFCSVHLQAPGLDLLWEKGDAVNRYVYNGREYTAVSRGTPEFLGEEFSPVKIGEEKRLLQVFDQFKPIFLLDESGTVVADVLSDVAHLDRINTAIRLAEKDRRDAIAERKVREKDIVSAKKRVSDFEGLDEAVARVQQVEEDESHLRKMQADSSRLEGFISRITTTAQRVKSLERVDEIQPPDASDIRTKSSLFNQLERFEAVCREKGRAVAGLRGVEKVEPPIIGPLLEKGSSFGALTAWVTKVRTFKDFFTKWGRAETVPVPVLSELLELASRYNRLVSLHGRYLAVSDAVRKLAEEDRYYSEEEARVKEAAKEFGDVCPTCFRPLLEVHTHGG